MRDVLLMAVVFGSLPFILRRPQIGVMMYVFVSVANPHRLTWGFAYDFNFAAVVGVVTLIAALFSKDLKRPDFNALTVALVLFLLWTGVTTIFALYPEPTYARWTALMKTALMAFLIPMLFHKKEDLRLMIWVIALSVGFFGIKGGVWTLLTGGVARVYGPGFGFIGDNNGIALALVMVIPLMRYLQLTTPHKHVRWGLTAMMLLCAVAVLGTYSRGALLAVGAMVAFLWWKGWHKFPVLLIVLVTAPVALSFMPEQWHARMDTIANFEQDSSANMRLNSWGTMLNLAKDRPIVGGGFELAERQIYDRYAPNPGFPPQVAHSIYFQALGEHGFVGLVLYLFLLAAFWRKATNIIRAAREREELAWAATLSLMMQVTLVGFAVGGAFLSFVTFDVTYYLVGVLIATLTLIKRESKPRAALRADENAHVAHASLRI